MTKYRSVNIITASAEDTIKAGKILGSNLKGGEVIELISDLGSGKTTLVKGIAQGSGSKELISSPSFTICNEYQSSKFKIYHFDFYRLNDPGIIRRELAEVINEDRSVVVIEWPEVIENILPNNHLKINISLTKNGDREISISYPLSLEYLAKALS